MKESEGFVGRERGRVLRSACPRTIWMLTRQMRRPRARLNKTLTWHPGARIFHRLPPLLAENTVGSLVCQLLLSMFPRVLTVVSVTREKG